MKENVIGVVGMLPIMKHLLAINHNLTNFVQSIVLHCSEAYIDAKSLEQSMSLLMREHDMLRATYNGESLYCNDINFQYCPILIYDLKEELDQETKMIECMLQIKTSFNLETGPLMKAAIFHMKDKTYLFITIHHFVIDAVSWRIFLDDLLTTYALVKQGVNEINIYKTDSYKKWVEMLDDYFIANSNELVYWSKIDKLVTVKISQREDSLARSYKNSKKQSKSFSKNISNLLEQEIHRAYTTNVNHILVSCLLKATHQYYDITGDIRVMMESHGREIHNEHIDLSRTIGWFTSLYPVVFHIPTTGHLSDFIIEAKDKINVVPNNGIGYGLMKYSDTHDSIDCGVEEIIFNYLGSFASKLGNETFSLASIDHDDQDEELNMLAKLEVNAGIYDGVLQVDMIYSTLDYKEEDILNLLAHFEDALIQIINWNCRQSGTALTISDLSDVEIAKEDLSAIIDMF